MDSALCLDVVCQNFYHPKQILLQKSLVEKSLQPIKQTLWQKLFLPPSVSLKTWLSTMFSKGPRGSFFYFEEV